MAARPKDKMEAKWEAMKAAQEEEERRRLESLRHTGHLTTERSATISELRDRHEEAIAAHEQQFVERMRRRWTEMRATGAGMAEFLEAARALASEEGEEGSRAAAHDDEAAQRLWAAVNAAEPPPAPPECAVTTATPPGPPGAEADEADAAVVAAETAWREAKAECRRISVHQPELTRTSSVGSDGDEFAHYFESIEDAARGSEAGGDDVLDVGPRGVVEGDCGAAFRLDHGELNRSRVLYTVVGIRGKVVAEAVDPMGATDEATGAAISLGRHIIAKASRRRKPEADERAPYHAASLVKGKQTFVVCVGQDFPHDEAEMVCEKLSVMLEPLLGTLGRRSTLASTRELSLVLESEVARVNSQGRVDFGARVF